MSSVPTLPASSGGSLDFQEASGDAYFDFKKSIASDVSDETALSLLKTVASEDSMYKEVSDDQLASMAAVLSVLKFKPGEMVISKGEHATFFGIILGGAFNAIISPTFKVRLQQGAMIGEMAYFEGGKRNADVATSEQGKECLLAVMLFKDIDRLMISDPELAQLILVLLSRAAMRKLRKSAGGKQGGPSPSPSRRSSIARGVEHKTAPTLGSERAQSEHVEMLVKARIQKESQQTLKRVEDESSRRKRAENRLRAQKKSILSLQDHIKRMKVEIEEMKARNETAVAHAQRQQQRLARTNESLKARMRSAGEKHAIELLESRKRFEAEKMEMRGLLDHAQSEKDRLRQQVSELTAERDSALNVAESNERQASNIKRQLTVTQQNMHSSLSGMHETKLRRTALLLLSKHRLRRAEKVVSSKEEDLEMLRNKLASATERGERLHETTLEQQRRIHMLESDLRSLESKRNWLEEELAGAKRTICIYDTNLKRLCCSVLVRRHRSIKVIREAGEKLRKFILERLHTGLLPSMLVVAGDNISEILQNVDGLASVVRSVSENETVPEAEGPELLRPSTKQRRARSISDFKDVRDMKLVNTHEAMKENDESYSVYTVSIDNTSVQELYDSTKHRLDVSCEMWGSSGFQQRKALVQSTVRTWKAERVSERHAEREMAESGRLRAYIRARKLRTGDYSGGLIAHGEGGSEAYSHELRSNEVDVKTQQLAKQTGRNFRGGRIDWSLFPSRADRGLYEGLKKNSLLAYLHSFAADVSSFLGFVQLLYWAVTHWKTTAESFFQRNIQISIQYLHLRRSIRDALHTLHHQRHVISHVIASQEKTRALMSEKVCKTLEDHLHRLNSSVSRLESRASDADAVLGSNGAIQGDLNKRTSRAGSTLPSRNPSPERLPSYRSPTPNEPSDMPQNEDNEAPVASPEEQTLLEETGASLHRAREMRDTTQQEVHKLRSTARELGADVRRLQKQRRGLTVSLGVLSSELARTEEQLESARGQAEVITRFIEVSRDQKRELLGAGVRLRASRRRGKKAPHGKRSARLHPGMHADSSPQHPLPKGSPIAKSASQLTSSPRRNDASGDLLPDVHASPSGPRGAFFGKGSDASEAKDSVFQYNVVTSVIEDSVQRTVSPSVGDEDIDSIENSPLLGPSAPGSFGRVDSLSQISLSGSKSRGRLEAYGSTLSVISASKTSFEQDGHADQQGSARGTINSFFKNNPSARNLYPDVFAHADASQDEDTPSETKSSTASRRPHRKRRSPASHSIYKSTSHLGKVPRPRNVVYERLQNRANKHRGRTHRTRKGELSETRPRRNTLDSPRRTAASGNANSGKQDK